MLLSEITESIMSESGQFIIGDIRCIGIDPKKFLSVILKELSYYQRYRPLTFRFTRHASTSVNGQYSVFFSWADPLTDVHDGSMDSGRVFNPRVGEFNRDPGMVPQWISEVVPSYGFGSVGSLFGGGLGGFSGTWGSGERSILHEPSTFLWHYEHDDDHGVLYTTMGVEKLDITAHYRYPVVDMVDVNGAFVDAEIKYLDAGTDEILLEIILGRFLVMLGRSRRAFQLNNSPINFDAAELVAEGQELVNTARTRLEETSNWWSAIGT